MIKTGVTTVTFRKLPFGEVLKLLRRTDIDGVEWGVCAEHFSVEDKAALCAIKEFCAEQQLEVFSLATYCDLSNAEEFAGLVAAAEAIGAPVMRVWAGKTCRSGISDGEYAAICARARELCGCAKEKNVRIGLEFHPNTLTNTAAEAIEFLKDVASDNLYLYWQPNEYLTHEENLNELKMVLPYLCGNIHVHNYHVEERAFYPLCDMQSQLTDYVRILQQTGREYHLIIEFVRDHRPEHFVQDALFLRELVKGIQAA